MLKQMELEEGLALKFSDFTISNVLQVKNTCSFH